MSARKLGWTDLEITSIGLGTWAMGGGGWAFGWGPQDDQISIQTVHQALELGVNWIDTAPAYGLGHCEEVVGTALKATSLKPILATKCGRSWDANGKLFPSLRKKAIQQEIDASLKRLRLEVIDLYQMHWPQPEEEIEEGWDAVAEAVRAGKVRYAGVCNFNVAQLRRIQPIHRVASAQPPYSMLVRGAEDELLSFCAEQNIGIVAYSPMQKGLLTGKVSRRRVSEFAEDDHRRRDPQFLEPLLSANLQLVDATLRPIAAKNGMSLSQVAIAWVLRRSEVTAAIVGARKPGQIEETFGGGSAKIPSEDLAAIEQALAAREKDQETS